MTNFQKIESFELKDQTYTIWGLDDYFIVQPGVREPDSNLSITVLKKQVIPCMNQRVRNGWLKVMGPDNIFDKTADMLPVADAAS